MVKCKWESRCCLSEIPFGINLENIFVRRVIVRQRCVLPFGLKSVETIVVLIFRKIKVKSWAVFFFLLYLHAVDTVLFFIMFNIILILFFMKTFLCGNKFLFLFIAVLSINSCADSLSEEDIAVTNNVSSGELKGCLTKTIRMFDSYITVLDSAGYYKFQDDIWIPKSYVDSDNCVSTRGAAITGRRWPDNKVYYTISDMPQKYKLNIDKAINIVERHSYIDFIPTKGVRGYIKFNYDASAKKFAYSDYLGMRNGGQNIVLSTGAIRSVGTIVHEICHAIGMDHEQNRSDRDNYLSIDFSKMPADEKYQYTKYTDKGLPGADVGDFDFMSIMLYSSNQYMRKKDGSHFYAQRNRLSTTDIITLATLQPLGKDFTFYAPLGYNEGVNSDYSYQRSKMMRCPEGAKVGFEFMYLNDFNSMEISPFSYDDFDISAMVKIVDIDNGKPRHASTLKIGESKDWVRTNIQEISLPQGFYVVYLILRGKVNGNSSIEKENVLKKLLCEPRIFLNLKSAKINGINKHIPSEYGNEKRALTFISI